MIATSRQQAPPPSSTGRVVAKGRLRQSVCRWCYSKIPLPEFFTAVAAMGLTAVDLLTEKEWPIAREHGLICSMGSGAGGSIADGLNVKANHEKILAALTRALPIAAAAKVPNLITFFGNRRGMGDPEAAANCIEALNTIKAVSAILIFDFMAYMPPSGVIVMRKNSAFFPVQRSSLTRCTTPFSASPVFVPF